MDGGASDPYADYPTVANSLLWVDRFRSCTDASGLVPAADGDSVRTIPLPSGWGASLGDGLVVQATEANRPIYRTNGLQCNSISTVMSLPATVSLPGAFAAYGVYNTHATSGARLQWFSGATPTYGGQILSHENNLARIFSNDLGYFQTLAVGNGTSLIMVRMRRDASNNIFVAATGVAEVALGSTSYTWALVQSFFGLGLSTAQTTCRMHQGVIVGADTVTAGTDASIQAKLLALESGLVGIS